MFLIKAAFWLSLLILLLPAEPAGDTVHAIADRAPAPQVTTGVLVDAALMTVDDFSGICERQPQVCLTGQAALDVFMRKAQYGFKMLARLAAGETTPAEPALHLAPRQHEGGMLREANGPADEPPHAATPVSQNTLTPADLEPEWRAPGADRA